VVRVKFSGLPAQEWAGDHPANGVLALQHLARLQAHPILLLDGMISSWARSEHAVRRGVHDRLSGAHVLQAELHEDLVPEAGLLPRISRPTRRQNSAITSGGKTVRVGGEGCIQPDAHQLPVARDSVFAARAASNGRMHRLGRGPEARP